MSPDAALGATGARVVIYMRQGCHLCDVADEVAREVCAEVGETVELVDIDPDPQLRHRWTDQVPVTFVDGRQHDFWRIDPDRLRAALTDRPTGGDDG